jgi:hypothetical protein
MFIIMPVKDNKEFNITIDQSLIYSENDTEIKTRVPRTFGENIRFLWLKKEDVETINNGKTLLTSLKPDMTYMLYDYKGNIAKNIIGNDLYNEHYDPVTYNSKQKDIPQKDIPENNQEKTSQQEYDNETTPTNNYNHIEGNNNRIINTTNNIVEEKGELVEDKKEDKKSLSVNDIINEQGSLSIPIISSIYDRSALKIAEHQEKIASLNDKNSKSMSKIEKSSDIVRKYAEIISTDGSKAFASPVNAILKLIVEHHKDIVTTQKEKISERNSKINTHIAKIDKHSERMETCNKIDVFLKNMKSSDGRKENYINGLKSFQSYSLKRNTLKLEKVNTAIDRAVLAYESSSSASEKLQLKDKLVKLKSQKDKTSVRLEALNSISARIEKLQYFSQQETNNVINDSYKGIVGFATENPEKFANNQIETTVDICKKSIDKTVQMREKENYLKNAEMSIEDDYDSIDGIINNGSKEQEQEKFSDTKTAKAKVKPEKLQSPLSKKQIISAPKKSEQNKQQVKNKEKAQAKNQPQELG